MIMLFINIIFEAINKVDFEETYSLPSFELMIETIYRVKFSQSN